jgi:hypothetical protein
MITFRKDREAIQRDNTDRMAIQLTHMQSTSSVFWGPRHNSYVCDGERIYSINGIGEIRWCVEPWNTDEESQLARAYFFEEHP